MNDRLKNFMIKIIIKIYTTKTIKKSAYAEVKFKRHI